MVGGWLQAPNFGLTLQPRNSWWILEFVCENPGCCLFLATYSSTIEGLVIVAAVNGCGDRVHLWGTLIRGVLILAESVLQRPFNDKNYWDRWDNKIDSRSSRSQLRNKWKGMRMKDGVKRGPEGSGSPTGYSQSVTAAVFPRKVTSAVLTSHLDIPSISFIRAVWGHSFVFLKRYRGKQIKRKI